MHFAVLAFFHGPSPAATVSSPHARFSPPALCFPEAVPSTTPDMSSACSQVATTGIFNLGSSGSSWTGGSRALDSVSSIGEGAGAFFFVLFQGAAVEVLHALLVPDLLFLALVAITSLSNTLINCNNNKPHLEQLGGHCSLHHHHRHPAQSSSQYHRPYHRPCPSTCQNYHRDQCCHWRRPLPWYWT